ncbi:MAG: MgtC/SapB family protein [Clostridia bacterium]|nr:MgtC/SapB family protein [Clostridia bacterium]
MFEIDIFDVLTRTVVAIIVGGLIGTERARHGRAAGMRTHILVCLGAALTAMTGVFVNEVYCSGDVMRISAQVISGIGFLGAGMIILKNGNVITGLTTAAGMWTTAVIGIALGYGFYEGALIVAAFYLISVILFAKLERSKRTTELVYIEIDDMRRTNDILAEIESRIPVRHSVSVVPPKSESKGNLGINITIKKAFKFDIKLFLDIEGVVFAIEE